jgi:hypothetical protein
MDGRIRRFGYGYGYKGLYFFWGAIRSVLRLAVLAVNYH